VTRDWLQGILAFVEVSFLFVCISTHEVFQRFANEGKFALVDK